MLGTPSDGTPFDLSVFVDQSAVDLHAGFTPNLAAFTPSDVLFSLGGTLYTPTNPLISFTDDVFGQDGLQFRGNFTISGVTQELLSVVQITGASFDLQDGTEADPPPLFMTTNPVQFSGSGVVGHNTFTVPANAPVSSMIVAIPEVSGMSLSVMVCVGVYLRRRKRSTH